MELANTESDKTHLAVPRAAVFSTEILDNPYPTYKALQDANPIFFDATQNAWIATKYSDVQLILKDAISFSSRRPISSSPLTAGYDFALFSQDPPEHSELRSCIQKAFTTSRIEKQRDWMQGRVEQLIDSITSPCVDIAQTIAIPLPIMVIARLLGIPDPHLPQLKSWTEKAVGHEDRDGGHAGRKAFLQMHAFFREQISRKRTEPADDILTELTVAHIGERRLSELEIINFCVTLLIAGNETTASLIGNMLHILASRPTVWEALKENEVSVRDVIEETLRFESPIQFISRKVAHATLLREQELSHGDRIIACLGAANRDGDVFAQPDCFLPDRRGPQHVAFSHGIHFCLGAALTRIETAIVLRTLVDRYNCIEPGLGSHRFSNVFFRGFKNLFVRLAK